MLNADPLNMRKITIKFYLILFLSLACPLYAQETLKYLLDAGKEISIVLPANSNTRKIELYTPSNGNDDDGVTFKVYGPDGTKASMQYLAVSSNLLAIDSAAKVTFAKAPLIEFRKSSTSKPVTLIKLGDTASNINGGGSSSGLCGGLVTSTDFKLYKSVYEDFLGKKLTDDEVCEIIKESLSGGSGGTSSDAPQSDGSTFYGILYKDACGKGKYLIKTEIDLSGLSKDTFTSELTIKTGMLFTNYSGGKELKIKPVTDGKYYPQPAYLAHSIGSSFLSLDYMIFEKWGKSTPSKGIKLDIQKRLFHHGFPLMFALTKGTLTGGKATIHVTNQYNSYNVCISATKKEIRYNGYPG